MVVDRLLPLYGELAVRVALNLRVGQRLLIIGPLANGGVSLEAAPLVRAVAAQAYAAGASYVEALWGDEALQLARFTHASRDTFDQCSSWFPRALADHVSEGHAVISISGNDPDLLKAQSPELVGLLQKGDVEATINVDPIVLRLLSGGQYRQILDADAEWGSIANSRLLVTTLAQSMKWEPLFISKHSIKR